MEIFVGQIKELANCQTEAGRILVERVAREHYGIEDTRIELRKKKPHFVASELCFSISHSKDFVAVCFDDNPVGFDIENISLLRNFEGLAERYGLSSSDPREFYKFWCGHEAKYKLGQPAAAVKSFEICDNYMAAVASGCEQELAIKLTFCPIVAD
jgi:phosphopantetheinyl transferase